MGVLMTDTELQHYSDAFTQYMLQDTCTILRNPDQSASTATPDGQGGYTGASSSSSVGWTSVTTVPCAVIEALVSKGGEPFQQGQLQSKSLKTVLLPRRTDVRDSDRLEVVSVAQGTSTTTFYEVMMCADPSTYEVLRRVYVERQGQGGN